MQQSNFTIYNASAGSGKTFTIVKDYLSILFASKNNEQFKHILAITFTNKAAGEMKERIIDALKLFSSPSILKNPNDLFKVICNDLKMNPELIHKKSITILNTLIHNYAAFDISTIDGFTHKIIRTFAFDLKIPLNFEVELDTDSMLSEAVDQLISKAGSDRVLTKILVDFAIEKADDDKSWDVSYDFNKIAKLLVNENDISHIETLKNKSLKDFETLKTSLRKKIKKITEKIILQAIKTLTLIENSNLEHSDFSRKTLPNHFLKISNGYFNSLYNNKLEENIENGSVYNKTLDENKADIINTILPEIEIAYKQLKNDIHLLLFYKNFYKNITPLSVLNAINKELNEIKEEQNKMLISEFNSIISKEIKDQPTPFIYERIGEKFRHYFIDEFQDTSTLQWLNLVPLIDNALSSENGSALLVGDAKQAIYRWRGGEAEQFIDLYNKKTPFQINPKIENLPTNYRSFKEIIEFNNSLFSYISENVFANDKYSKLYNDGINQNTFINHDGYVNLSILDIPKDDELDIVYPQKVLETIHTCLDNDYLLEDICVLVRKKKEGVAIANYLSQHNIDILSSETLIISHSKEVMFIINILKLLIHPENKEIKIEVLNYLASVKLKLANKHDFFKEQIILESPVLFKNFAKLNYHIDYNQLLQLPIYEIAETIVRAFNLVKKSDAYIQYFLDFILEYSQKHLSNLSGFIDHFEKKKDSLSIIFPEGQNAVKIMTIHKSKGLEFPVVIFPYADLDIYKELEPKVWFPLDVYDFNGFSDTLINFNEGIQYLGEKGQFIYNDRRSQLELDNINLLYVALTRPIEQLYIISKINSLQKEGSTTYSGIFISYLKHLNLWNESEQVYHFGNPFRKTLMKDEKQMVLEQNEFISTPKQSHRIKVVTSSGYLWDTAQEKAIERGNLVHNIMAHIVTKDDITFVINDFIAASLISPKQAELVEGSINKIVNHPKLKLFYTNENDVYNERDIITKEGFVLRPDRVVSNNNVVTIIDYKTGSENESHTKQIESYKNALEEMDFVIKNKFLVYINDDIEVKEL